VKVSCTHAVAAGVNPQAVGAGQARAHRHSGQQPVREHLTIRPMLCLAGCRGGGRGDADGQQLALAGHLPAPLDPLIVPARTGRSPVRAHTSLFAAPNASFYAGSRHGPPDVLAVTRRTAWPSWRASPRTRSLPAQGL
jgi:hypothetical protein